MVRQTVLSDTSNMLGTQTSVLSRCICVCMCRVGWWCVRQCCRTRPTCSGHRRRCSLTCRSTLATPSAWCASRRRATDRAPTPSRRAPAKTVRLAQPRHAYITVILLDIRAQSYISYDTRGVHTWHTHVIQC